MLAADQKPDALEVIAGRYRIEADLGRGGMARVYRVLDTRSGERLALKQLLATGENAPTLQAMFEREYHTLVQLTHPRIVRVFDYGVDTGRPYYTMELLEGCHARDITRGRTFSVQETCVLLRDIASALALIHSRRMVHRDVSLRNVWCTADGGAKLIDFGTLVALGPQSRVAGTPPFVPPEALHMQPLDGRCDLFALGACAYYLLTGRNAYPAREMKDLRKVWERRPQSPAAFRQDLPPALSELVMALLSLDARARPGSAAEVVDRVSAIGQLPLEDERHLAQAFLTTPKLVGRDEQVRLLRRRVQAARKQGGGTAAIVAPAGLGRSAMLTSVVIDAKLMGSAVVSIDASAVTPGPFAVAGAVAERLLELLPMTAAQVVDSAGVLAHVSPALQRALGEPALAALTPFERSRKLSAALVALVETAAQHGPLVLAVDDVHRADGDSLGVLGAIAALAGDRSLLLVTTCDETALRDPSVVLAQLAPADARIALAPLDAAHTRELIGSLFGEVAGLDEAASWLHELSSGSPQTCMQYAQHLVDRGLARYEGGQWRLPEHLRREALPETLGVMLESRLAGLSEDARALALGLALARDDTRAAWQPENRVRFEDFPKLLGLDAAAAAADETTASGQAARTFAALDELLRVGLVQQRDSLYVLGQRAVIDALLRTSDDRARKEMYERLVQVFDHGSYLGGLLAVRQLQLAGEHARARARLIAFADHLGGKGSMNWGGMRLSATVQCYLEALDHWQAEGGRVRDGIVLRRLLVLISSVYDWSLARFGDAHLSQLRSDCGLVHWDDTDRSLPAIERLIECLKRAAAAYERTPEAQRGLPPQDAIRELGLCVAGMQGSAVNSHDVGRAQRLRPVMEPLRPLAPTLALACDLSELALDRVTGRELGERLRSDGVDRVLAATELPEVTRLGAAAVNLHVLSIEDARRGRKREHDLMDVLVPTVGEEMFMVVHSRWFRHAFDGNAELARSYRKRVEVITEDDVWRRKATLFVEAELHALTGDLLELARTCEAIATLASAFPGWQPWRHWARAALQKLRGDVAGARIELDAALAAAVPGEHRAWSRIAPASAELRLLQDDARGALREANAITESVQRLSLDRFAEVAAERVRALAHSRLGDHDAAVVSAERALLLAGELEFGGLPLALLHESQARVLLAAQRADDAAAALGRLHRALERSDARALVHAYESLRGELRTLVDVELPAISVARSDVVQRTEVTQLSTEVYSRLRAVSGRQERAHQALSLLIEESGARDGHLFLFDAGGLFAAASSGDGATRPDLLYHARRHVEDELTKCLTADATIVVSTDAKMAQPEPVALEFVPVLLTDGQERGCILAGIALLSGAGPLKPPRVELLRAVSRCLHMSGDSIARRIDG